MGRFLMIVGSAILTLALAGCTSSREGSAQAVEGLLEALVTRNEPLYTSLTCPEYEAQALIEYDSFGLVESELTGVACTVAGSEGENSLVRCTGSIDATYGNEVRSFALAPRTYRVVVNSGEWLVCGYTK
jgi:hypothetical protein